MTTNGIDTATAKQTAEEWSDETLLARMLLKEHLGWKEFHRRFDRLVYRCIHKVTSRFPASLSSEDVREIYAQFLLGLTRRDMHKLRTFDAERGNKLSSWVGMLATNAAWDYLRTVARQPQCTELSDAESVGEIDSDPYEKLLEKERWGRIDATLRSFSAKDQVFVRLYYMDGLSPEEVAEEMRISVKTVYSKKHKIRCRLQRMLQPMMDQAA
ncbi:MAG: sigma-70 family RNA polymerase sigma factor [Myxococcota bacterium]|nr:sigma-70 family RNA polymerase sigma factor [Myxococcota bacterium]